MAFLTAERRERIASALLANLCLVGTYMVAALVAAGMAASTDDPIALSTVPLLVGAAVVTAAIVRLHAGASWQGLGLGPAGSLSAGAAGLGMSAAACGLLVACLLASGHALWTPIEDAQVRFDWRSTPATGVLFLAVGAAGEELFLRGLLLQLLARAAGPSAAIALTSAGFALLHGWNPGVTILAQLNTALFGAVFGIAALRRGSLWLAFGLHLGWNLAQVALGANNSGITIRLTGLNLELLGEGWLSGGSYGLEGGVLASVAALALAGAVWRRPPGAAASHQMWRVVREAPPPGGGRAAGLPLGLAAGRDSDSAGQGADAGPESRADP